MIEELIDKARYEDIEDFSIWYTFSEEEFEQLLELMKKGRC